MKIQTLQINRLSASAGKTEILRNVNLIVKTGQVHAIMGPNGSGKSTLANVIMGNPVYQVNIPPGDSTGGIYLNRRNISGFTPEKRAKSGIYLAFQSPVPIPGVSVIQLLRSAYKVKYSVSKSGNPKKIHNPVMSTRWDVPDMTIFEFSRIVSKYAQSLALDNILLSRGIHDGFSGGERKKIELLQALVLKPAFAVFDEIDTGLDVDALKTVAAGIKALLQQGCAVVIITHYQRILKYINLTAVHIMVKGTIVRSGDADLVSQIEAHGYGKYLSGIFLAT